MSLTPQLLSLVKNYQPSKKVLASIAHVPVLALVGLTVAGKDTVKRRLLKDYPNRYHPIVSHTTRLPRHNHDQVEIDGHDYHFVNFKTIKKMLENDQFVEAKVIHGSNIYGTSIAEIKSIKAQRQTAMTDINVHGVEEYMRLGLNIKPVFLLPPSYQVWQQRLINRHRGKVNKVELASRFKSALAEIDEALKHDYYYIVINKDLDETVQLVDKIGRGLPVEPRYEKAVKTAEKLRTDIESELEAL